MATITSSRIYKGQQMNKTGEETVLKFEEFPHVALSKVKTRLSIVIISRVTIVVYSLYLYNRETRQ